MVSRVQNKVVSVGYDELRSDIAKGPWLVQSIWNCDEGAESTSTYEAS